MLERKAHWRESRRESLCSLGRGWGSHVEATLPRCCLEGTRAAAVGRVSFTFPPLRVVGRHRCSFVEACARQEGCWQPFALGWILKKVATTSVSCCLPL